LVQWENYRAEKRSCEEQKSWRNEEKVNASNKVPGQNEILVKAEAHGCKLSASSLF